MSRSEDWVRLRHMLGAAQEALAFIDGRSRGDLERFLRSAGHLGQ